MTNDECQMTNEARIPKPDPFQLSVFSFQLFPVVKPLHLNTSHAGYSDFALSDFLRASEFELRISFVIWPSSFVIFIP